MSELPSIWKLLRIYFQWWMCGGMFSSTPGLACLDGDCRWLEYSNVAVHDCVDAPQRVMCGFNDATLS